MTLEEKVLLTGGVTSNTGCAGWISNITRLGFPGMCLQDAGNGLRSTDFVTAWSSGISVGARYCCHVIFVALLTFFLRVTVLLTDFFTVQLEP